MSQMFRLTPSHRNIPDDDLIEDLQSVREKLGAETVTIDEYNDHGRYHATTLTRRFGSWFVALEKAGLRKTRNLNITNDELFENLALVWSRSGAQPTYQAMAKPLSKYSAGTYENRFGSWRNALEEFVKWANGNSAFNAPALPNISATSDRKTPRNVNWRLRAQVLMRDGAICKLCGASPIDGAKLHVDHVVPWSKGGETVLENLQILCDKCNIGKSDLI